MAASVGVGAGEDVLPSGEGGSDAMPRDRRSFRYAVRVEQ